MFFKVKDELLNSVLGYLGTRPFQEVAGLIQAIHAGAEAIQGQEDGQEISIIEDQA